MIGLQSIKENMQITFDRIRFENNRKKMGFSVPPQHAHHMIFTGNPGTGKTTVAQMIGKIYHSLGLLSQGDVIVTERA